MVKEPAIIEVPTAELRKWCETHRPTLEVLTQELEHTRKHFAEFSDELYRTRVSTGKDEYIFERWRDCEPIGGFGNDPCFESRIEILGDLVQSDYLSNPHGERVD